MAPKKKQQHQRQKQIANQKSSSSKSKSQSSDSKSTPKLQISAENERRLRRLLLNSDRPPAPTPPPNDTALSKSQKAKRLHSIYEKLSCEGFTADQIEQALSVLNVSNKKPVKHLLRLKNGIRTDIISSQCIQKLNATVYLISSR
ncbi:hypothetical protein ACLOJK_001061 [Asimina triloba]